MTIDRGGEQVEIGAVGCATTLGQPFTPTLAAAMVIAHCGPDALAVLDRALDLGERIAAQGFGVLASR